MEIKCALNLLGIKTMGSIEDIKKAYRIKIKNSHPDAGGSDDIASKINIAYSTILKHQENIGYIPKSTQFKPSKDFGERDKSIIISLSDLDNIIKFGEINKGGNIIDKKKLKNTRVVVDDTVNIQVTENGVVSVFDTNILGSMRNNSVRAKYEMDYSVALDYELKNEVELKVVFRGKTLKTNTDSKINRFEFKFGEDYSIALRVKLA